MTMTMTMTMTVPRSGQVRSSLPVFNNPAPSSFIQFFKLKFILSFPRLPASLLLLYGTPCLSSNPAVTNGPSSSSFFFRRKGVSSKAAAAPEAVRTFQNNRARRPLSPNLHSQPISLAALRSRSHPSIQLSEKAGKLAPGSSFRAVPRHSSGLTNVNSMFSSFRGHMGHTHTHTTRHTTPGSGFPLSHFASHGTQRNKEVRCCCLGFVRQHEEASDVVSVWARLRGKENPPPQPQRLFAFLMLYHPAPRTGKTSRR